MTNVLIVDDHAENLYMLRVLLEAHGFQVEEARDGAEALGKARYHPPDLVISDLLMPVLDGYAFLRQWRADDRLKRIPFIVYTATYTSPGDERLGLDLGADAFIVKPVEPDHLMEQVRTVLAKRRRGGPAAAPAAGVGEEVLLKDYNEVLVRKLEKKAMEAERTNHELRRQIAERRRAEDRLRESEERFRATFEQTAVGIVHVDADGRFVWVNEKFCGMTGYERDELLHLTFLDLTAPEDRAASDAARQAMLAGRQTVYSAEKRYRRKDGSLFWGNVVTTLLKNDAAGSKHFAGVVLDITDRRTLEDQLRQSQKMEAIGRLAGGVAHDFNNLLTIIFGYSEMLLEVPDVGDRERRAVRAIREATERATALTRQLLGFSRQALLQPQVLDLNAVVTDIGKMLRRLIGEDIQLTTVLDPNLSRVKVDPGQLDQVLLNLAVNARDAMPQGGRLTIETSNVSLSADYAASHLDCKPGPHVMLAMTDTGIGMSPDVLGRIFEPFYTTKGVDKGTGLGLSMVFGIVRQSDGWIHVYSEPGHGTTFRIFFPVATGEAVAATAPPPRAAAHGNETILLVEDDAGVRALATRGLQIHGYTVMAAQNGQDALKIVDAHHGPLDLVLTDVVMPDVSGPELAKILRVRAPHLKVLFMSGYTDDAVIRHGFLDADVAFIQKPYTPLGLAQRVRHVLDS
jgi:PAS domain S-box-containing protein